MFTDKEAKEFIKYVETAQLVDINFPDFELPNWLPDNLKNEIIIYTNSIKKFKDNPVRHMCDFYFFMTAYFIRVLPIFINPYMKEMWLKLNKISPEKTEQFIMRMLIMENDFQGALSLYFKHIGEKNCFNKILTKTEEIKDLLEEYQYHFYGHMITNEFFELEKIIKSFQKKSIKKLKVFEEDTKDISYLFSSWRPITREYQSEKALPIFFARKIALYFREEYNKPYNAYVAEIVSLIFDKTYSENEIIKMTKPIKKFLKSENSVS